MTAILTELLSIVIDIRARAFWKFVPLIVSIHHKGVPKQINYLIIRGCLESFTEQVLCFMRFKIHESALVKVFVGKMVGLQMGCHQPESCLLLQWQNFNSWDWRLKQCKTRPRNPKVRIWVASKNLYCIFLALRLPPLFTKRRWISEHWLAQSWKDSQNFRYDLHGLIFQQTK